MPSPSPLVTADELADLLHDPDVVVADVRWYLGGRSGREAFEEGHLPGAVFVDLDTVLSGSPATGQGRHPLPDPGELAGNLGRLGIGDGAFVVAYDDAGGSVAARLWWMLRAIGQRAAVLDGGIAAWAGALETGAGAHRPSAARAPVPWPAAALADADRLDLLAQEGALVLLDARAPARYRGDEEPVDPKPGHVPGARNAPWQDNLDPATGRFLPADRLRARYLALMGADGTDVVAYCGSGVTACHDLLALEVAGLGPGRLYAGSWSEWSSRSDRPVATGDEP
jgi:thiosulfate/3-mercaptopyruvate sulfurtransferase